MRWLIATALLSALVLVALATTLLDAPSTGDEPGTLGNSVPEKVGASSASDPRVVGSSRTFLLGKGEEGTSSTASGGMRARLLDIEGNPLVLEDVQVHVSDGTPSRTREQEARTDETGVLHLPLPEPWPEHGRVDLLVHAVGFARVLLPALDPGSRLNLGDVTLRTVLAAGTVVDRNGRPVEGALVEVRNADSGLPVTSLEDPERNLRCTSDDRGRFLLEGTQGATTSLQLVARHQRDGVPLRSLPSPFAPGRSEIVLRLEAPGTIDGFVRLDSWNWRSPFEVVALDAQGRERRRTRLVAGAPGEATHRFTLDDLDAGMVDVVIVDRTRSAPLWRVTGVRVIAGARDEDPRLDLVDLTDQRR